MEEANQGNEHSTISSKEDGVICWSQAGSVQKRRLWSSEGNAAD